MSWLWSSPAPENEAEPSSSESKYSDPYAGKVDTAPTDSFGAAPTADLLGSSSTLGTFSSPSRQPESFGSAFEDEPTDLDSGSSQTSFDVFSAPPPPPGPAFDATAPSLSSGLDVGAGIGGSPPAVDFGSMARINPGVLARRDPSSGPGLDYVFTEDYSDFRKKSSSEQLTYLTGSAYLLGTAAGAVAGLSSALPASAGKAPRLRVNAALNAVAKRGTGVGNACAVIALTFSLSEAAIYNYTNDETLVNYAAAGAATGALYKSTRGLRVAGIWGAAGAGLALATVYASRRGYYGRGMQGIL